MWVGTKGFTKGSNIFFSVIIFPKKRDVISNFEEADRLPPITSENEGVDNSCTLGVTSNIEVLRELLPIQGGWACTLVSALFTKLNDSFLAAKTEVGLPLPLGKSGRYGKP